MLKRVASLVASGVHVIALLALSDEGVPFYGHDMASQFAGLGISTFACTPGQFPDLMAHAITKQDMNSWAAKEGLVLSRKNH